MVYIYSISQYEKMKKKRTGLVHSLRMIHGSSLEGVETRICSARSALIEATAELQELVQVSPLTFSLTLGVLKMRVKNLQLL